MTEEKRKFPKLRFPEFFDAWEQRKFSDIAETRRGLTYKPENITESGGIRVLRSSNINEDTFVFSSDDVFVEPTAVKIPLVKNGDILITSANGSSRLVGKHSIVRDLHDNSAVHGGFMLLASAKEPEFVNALMGAAWYTKFINTFVAGGNGAIGNLNKSDLDNQIVFIPSIEEQKKIGQFFKSLDNLITLHQRKLETTKKLKQGFLQKLFPQNGKKIPELRFPEFTGDWEQRKLGELSEPLEYGLNAAAKTYDGENKYLRITDIDDSSREFKYDDLSSPDTPLENASYFLLNEQDIVFARTGASVGKTFRYKEKYGKVYYAGFLIRARIKQDFDPEFVYQNTLTSSYDNFIRLTSQRSGQPGVNAKEYSSFNFCVPSFKEQKKIGAFFSKLDNLITLHQRKLEIYQNIKKGLLQQMFV